MESNMKVMMGNKQEEEEEENRRDDGGNLPPGFRFHPTDEELVAHYLTHKVLDSTFSARAIADVDLNKCEPWDLPAKAKMGEKEWYFFSLRDRKYPTGLRTNRATEAGYWKATGKDREIFRGRTTTLIGMKKTLVFYKGRAPKGEKSNWVMHEYRLEGKFSYYNLPKTAKEEWVVSRIFKKNISGGGKKNSLGLSATSCLNDLDSSALPPLLESPYVTPNAVTEGSRSLESESGSAREHVSCFSTPMETFKDYNAAGIKGFATRSSADQQRDALPADSAEISEIANIMRSSPYLQTILQLNDPLLNINTNSAISPFCNLGKQDNASHLFPHGVLPSLPSYPMAGPNVNFPPRDHMNTQNNGLIPPNSILRALVDQFAGNGDPMSLKQCKMEQPSPSSFGNNKALRMPGDQWLNGLSSSSTSGSLQGNFGIAQQMQTAQPMVSISQDTCLSADMNPEISSVVSNQLNRTTYNENQGRPSSSAAAPVDLDCLWTY